MALAYGYSVEYVTESLCISQILYLFIVAMKNEMQKYEIWGKMLGGSKDEEEPKTTHEETEVTPKKRKFSPDTKKYDLHINADMPIDQLRYGVGKLGLSGPVGQWI